MPVGKRAYDAVTSKRFADRPRHRLFSGATLAGKGKFIVMGGVGGRQCPIGSEFVRDLSTPQTGDIASRQAYPGRCPTGLAANPCGHEGLS